MTDRLTVATWLVEERHLSVIPLAPREKKPSTTWTAFQHARPSRDNLTAWFGNSADRNLGIVTGAVSGVIAIDCDSPEAIAWADTHLPPTPMITRTFRGEHRFFRHPGVPVRNAARIKTGNGRLALDVRGDGGYVVGPTSQHPSGATYERFGAWPPIDELPVFEPAWLEAENAVSTFSESRQVRRARERRDKQNRDRVLNPDFRFGCGAFAHSISRQALIFAGFSRETRPRRVTPSG